MSLVSKLAGAIDASRVSHQSSSFHWPCSDLDLRRFWVWVDWIDGVPVFAVYEHATGLEHFDVTSHDIFDLLGCQNA